MNNNMDEQKMTENMRTVAKAKLTADQKLVLFTLLTYDLSDIIPYETLSENTGLSMQELIKIENELLCLGWLHRRYHRLAAQYELDSISLKV